VAYFPLSAVSLYNSRQLIGPENVKYLSVADLHPFPTLTTAQNINYTLAPPSLLLVEPNPIVKKFNDPQQTARFLIDLNMDQTRLNELATTMGIATTNPTTPTPVKKTQRIQTPSSITPQITAMAQALIDRQFFLLEQPSRIKPPRTGPENQPLEPYTHRLATLGPHEEPGYVPPQVTKSKTEQRNDDIGEIRRLMKSQNPRDRQEAIDKTIKSYAIDMKGVKFVKYNDALEDNGITSKNGAVEIGKAAFLTASPGWLGSTLGHEIEVHIQEQALKGNWWVDEQGTAMQEVQAYDYELKNAERYGLTKEEIKELRWARKDYYLDLNDENKALVSKNDYSVYIP